MKKFVVCAMQIKTNMALGFGASIFLYSLAACLLGERAMPYSMIWQLMAICMVASTLQLIFFSGVVIKNMKYWLRQLLFNVPMFTLITIFAIIFRWFPAGNSKAWLIFFAVFIAVEIIITMVFVVYTKYTGQSYNQQLEHYKRKSTNK